MSADELNIQQYKKMTETPIPKLILGLAAPTILSMLITSIYNLADTFFVGQISTSASGAVGIVSSLMAIIQALGFTLGHGSGTIISRSLGFHQLFYCSGRWRGAGRCGPCHSAQLHDAAGQHRDHSAPRLRLCTAHPHCSPAYDLQPCDEQHPAL